MSRTPTSWQDSCSTITSALTYMLNHEIVVDAIFKKDKTSSFFAHKLILAIWSPKFADWISETDERQMFSIIFEEDEDVLKTILQYLYSPDDIYCFTKMPTEKLIQALEISERYEINHVYKKCLSILRRRKINPLNVIDYFEYGLRKNFLFIVKKCVKVFENEGISSKLIKEDFSINSLINLLSLQKIAMNSEADLLRLVISWLSYPDNRCYKYDVLSFIDLQSINIAEYQDICKKYPHFFSDDELSSIILSELRQDPLLLPKWYKPKIKSVVENKCSLCIHIHKRMKVSKPLHFLKVNNRKDLKTVTQKFGFDFQQFSQVKILNMELNFGPNEISSNEFSFHLSLNRSTPVKKYYVRTSKINDNYKVYFKPPLTLKSKDKLSLKFYFCRGFLANNIHIIWPTAEQIQESPNVAEGGDRSIHIYSPELAFYAASKSPEKYIISSFYLNVCDNHGTFLSRKRNDLENISNMIDVNRDFKHNSETIPFEVAVKTESADIKMEVDDKPQHCNNAVTLSDVKPFIKKEFVSLDTDDEDTVQFVPYNSVTYKIPEIIDLTDEL